MFLARLLITKHQLFLFSRSQKLIEDPFLLSSLEARLSLLLPIVFFDSQQHVQLYFMSLCIPKVSSSVRSPVSHTSSNVDISSVLSMFLPNCSYETSMLWLSECHCCQGFRIINVREEAMPSALHNRDQSCKEAKYK